MIKRTALLALAGLVAVAAPARAQDAHAGHGAAQQGGMMKCMMPGMEHGGMQHGAAAQGQAAHAQHQGMPQGQNMHQGMANYIANPGMLLHHQADLALTADQVQRIEALQKQAQSDCEQHMKIAHEQHMSANAALSAQTPDVAAFEARLKEASQHMVQAHVAVARRGVEALNVLTAAQRTKLQSGKHDGHGSGH